MTAAQLASSFVSRALEESKLSAKRVSQLTNISRKQISRIKCGRTKLGGRLDTLVALLAACGYELRMERKEKQCQRNEKA